MGFNARYLAHNVLNPTSRLGVSLRTDPPLTIKEVVGASNLGAITNDLVFTPIETGANAITLERRSITYQSWDFFIVWHNVPYLLCPIYLMESYPIKVVSLTPPQAVWGASASCLA